MNMLKITNDVLWWILCPSKYLIEHEHVKNYISLNMNVIKIYKWCVMMDILLIVVQTNMHKDLKLCEF
jgi:hypothetical protein